MNKTYSVKINKSNHFFREIAGLLFFITTIGFAIWTIVDLPVKNNFEISILYYSNLPVWLLQIFSLTFVTGLTAYFLFRSRTNSKGILSVHADQVEIQSKREPIVIKINDLKRIGVIEKSFSFRPHRLEFIFYNKKFVRVVFSSEDDFEEVITDLTQIAPDKLDNEVSQFES